MVGLHKVEDMSDDAKSVFELSFTKQRDFQAEAMRLEFRITDGQVAWSYSKAREVRANEVAQLLADGKTHKQIAAELGITRSYVTKIARKVRQQPHGREAEAAMEEPDAAAEGREGARGGEREGRLDWGGDR
jgi:hypothetical protein